MEHDRLREATGCGEGSRGPQGSGKVGGAVAQGGLFTEPT